jgi:hypothetical protein
MQLLMSANAPDDKCSRVGSPRIYACGLLEPTPLVSQRRAGVPPVEATGVEAGIVDRCQMMSSK